MPRHASTASPASGEAARRRRPVLSATLQDGVVVSRRDLFDNDDDSYPAQQAATPSYPALFQPLQWSATSSEHDRDTASMMDHTAGAAAQSTGIQPGDEHGHAGGTICCGGGHRGTDPTRGAAAMATTRVSA
ncbi:hypothetical protein SYNPS1DRAFT_31295 [Syncephalis pseudoplumigaleata]|uniref:Uncharacterized protein n=1 Tax=Syncephalis pseudoplumigaleata TaxID=1712513 RepID=A0A4P9YTA3_9FUNG|nr:hypothetical protein SYNPS1DRAFT_31346 [Syncephalis pseudoplumigaleata]RKP23014.1 hypothetical protein SYNPS1DRAFT_31295 [Syncephalis pseudoplumigaleata]|eukprot:RKP22965.1 hypothetical protein SYNPS1DRAFT_31346 [Syncephalis pseudoplumigaleata]